MRRIMLFGAAVALAVLFVQAAADTSFAQTRSTLRHLRHRRRGRQRHAVRRALG